MVQNAPDRPWVAVNLSHIFRRDAHNPALLDNLGILPDGAFDNGQVLHRNARIDSMRLIPTYDALLRDVDNDIIDFAAFAAGNNVG